mmetsp:Transcript_123921/g.264210  ORF Transcript_123921/g.264210 Transcript_123921/m.264210 type:complete len:249 (-) Transcript_123921:711-1457(-)
MHGVLRQARALHARRTNLGEDLPHSVHHRITAENGLLDAADREVVRAGAVVHERKHGHLLPGSRLVLASTHRHLLHTLAGARAAEVGGHTGALGDDVIIGGTQVLLQARERYCVLLALGLTSERAVHLLSEAVQEKGHVMVRGVHGAHHALVQARFTSLVILAKVGQGHPNGLLQPLAEPQLRGHLEIERLEHKGLHVLAWASAFGREAEGVGVPHCADHEACGFVAEAGGLDGAREELHELWGVQSR